jgi:organic hydroperoxide reductase OsmC/OhrA
LRPRDRETQVSRGDVVADAPEGGTVDASPIVMTAPFPHHYTASVVRTGRARADLTAPPRPPLQGGAPPEFGGIATDWSPEHLLLAAVGLCLETTFEAIAERNHLPLDQWEVRVDGDVDRTAAGLAFTSITAHIEMTVADEMVELAHVVANKARHCLISSSLRPPIDVVHIVMSREAGRRLA